MVKVSSFAINQLWFRIACLLLFPDYLGLGIIYSEINYHLYSAAVLRNTHNSKCSMSMFRIPTQWIETVICKLPSNWGIRSWFTGQVQVLCETIVELNKPWFWIICELSQCFFILFWASRMFFLMHWEGFKRKERWKNTKKIISRIWKICWKLF